MRATSPDLVCAAWNPSLLTTSVPSTHSAEPSSLVVEVAPVLWAPILRAHLARLPGREGVRVPIQRENAVLDAAVIQMSPSAPKTPFENDA